MYQAIPHSSAQSLLQSGGVELLFDRGTLLLRHPPCGLEVEKLAGVRWDPRVQLHRAPARRYGDLVRELSHVGVQFRDAVRATGQLPLPWHPIQLRPYQEAALSAWDLAGRRGVVALPTGSGKTQLALAAMARSRMATLCVVPTRVLLEQWVREIGVRYQGPVGCFGDGERSLAPVTVATYESAYRHMDRLGDRFDLLVVDEAHHFGQGLRDEVLEMSTASARLGLTATPPGAEAAVRLADLVGPVVYELGIGDLAGGRYLASFELITLHLDLSPEERSHYEQGMAAFRQVHGRFRELAPMGRWEDFARWAGRIPEGRNALQGWRAARSLLSWTEAKRRCVAGLIDRHRAARLLVFTPDNPTTYAIAREHLIMPLTCDIARPERDEALARFRRGELRALVSSQVLNEGLDVPEAEVGVIVGGRLGDREHVQRVGRLLRPAAGKEALVFDLVTRGTVEVRQARRRREGLAPRSETSR